MGWIYDAASVRRTVALLESSGLVPRLVIDTSHGNSGKDYRNQPRVAHEVAEQVAQGEWGICGVMVESFLVEDSQKVTHPAQLTYGQSITDGCMNWQTTVPIVQDLASAVRSRRNGLS